MWFESSEWVRSFHNCWEIADLCVNDKHLDRFNVDKKKLWSFGKSILLVQAIESYRPICSGVYCPILFGGQILRLSIRYSDMLFRHCVRYSDMLFYQGIRYSDMIFCHCIRYFDMLFYLDIKYSDMPFCLILTSYSVKYSDMLFHHCVRYSDMLFYQDIRYSDMSCCPGTRYKIFLQAILSGCQKLQHAIFSGYLLLCHVILSRCQIFWYAILRDVIKSYSVTASNIKFD